MIETNQIDLEDDPIQQMVKLMVKVGSIVKRRELSPINETAFRKSQRAYRLAIINNCLVYLQEHRFVVNDENDPTTFQEASNSLEWMKAMDSYNAS